MSFLNLECTMKSNFLQIYITEWKEGKFYKKSKAIVGWWRVVREVAAECGGLLIEEEYNKMQYNTK